jgi:hypothetical protein
MALTAAFPSGTAINKVAGKISRAPLRAPRAAHDLPVAGLGTAQ